MIRSLSLLLVVLMMGACRGEITTEEAIVGNPRPITARTIQLVRSQVLYIPAYSEIFFGSTDQTIQLAVTLSIHNTDFDHEIIVHSVRYYNTDGELVREYIESPVEVSPLATIGFVVPDNDLSGGWGAIFIVEWGAEQAVHEPIVEAIMVSTRGTQGISMISSGRILSQTLPGAETAEDTDQGS